MNDPGEKWETCPYDKSHELLQSRMQQHLDKCKLQYIGLEKTTCRFNSTHVINKVEYACHIKICPDRVIEDTFVMRVGAESRPVGLLPVENVNVNYHDADECGNDEELVQPRVSPAPVGPSAQTLPIPQELKKTNAPPPDVVEPTFVHDTPQPSSTYSVPSNPWTGSTFAAPQVDNTQDFPTLGTKGPRRDNGNGLQDSLNHLSLNDKPNAWGRPAPRQQDARISVPSTGSSVGSGNRSFGNPWSNRSQQATRSDPSGPSEFDSPSVTSVTKDDFPSLSTSGYGRGRRQRN